MRVKDDDNRTDKEVDDECWRDHLACDASIIVDMCQVNIVSKLCLIVVVFRYGIALWNYVMFYAVLSLLYLMQFFLVV